MRAACARGARGPHLARMLQTLLATGVMTAVSGSISVLNWVRLAHISVNSARIGQREPGRREHEEPSGKWGVASEKQGPAAGGAEKMRNMQRLRVLRRLLRIGAVAVNCC
jgi:hypothetical protein